MSNEAGTPENVSKTETIEKQKGTRSRPVKKRRYHETTAYKGKTAETLSALHTAGHTVEFVVPSPDIMGFEILSYTEE